ncbi:uncharacterized protein LOC143241087 [Tachypleus tridentatus]|uniref:uncharacterized protein LOC143241087 n=1 Tax=Tachypleus tridentatus TaxID=6853 RepID=UPI003FD2FC60
MELQLSVVLYLILICFLTTARCKFFSNVDEDSLDGFFRKIVRSRCPRIRNELRHGRVKIRSQGRIAKFICDSGFERVGRRFATCVRGRWNNPVPVCVRAGCDDLDAPPNGKILELYGGALVKFDCNPGYRIDGSFSLYCDGSQWNDTVPLCVVASDNSPLSCDFEDASLCDWTHDPQHDFDWKQHQFGTPSGHVGTGPSFDHTFGQGKAGRYMYIEASAPRKENDTARLYSPVYPADKSNSCFTFWYHMFGAQTGYLRIYIKSSLHVLAELSPDWEKFGDQGNQWLQGQVPVPQLLTEFQIIVEGVRGASYVGDTAIDDVDLQPNSCQASTSQEITTTGRTLPTTAKKYVPVITNSTSIAVITTKPTFFSTGPSNTTSTTNVSTTISSTIATTTTPTMKAIISKSTKTTTVLTTSTTATTPITTTAMTPLATITTTTPTTTTTTTSTITPTTTTTITSSTTPTTTTTITSSTTPITTTTTTSSTTPTTTTTTTSTTTPTTTTTTTSTTTTTPTTTKSTITTKPIKITTTPFSPTSSTSVITSQPITAKVLTAITKKATSKFITTPYSPKNDKTLSTILRNLPSTGSTISKSMTPVKLTMSEEALTATTPMISTARTTNVTTAHHKSGNPSASTGNSGQSLSPLTIGIVVVSVGVVGFITLLVIVLVKKKKKGKMMEEYPEMKYLPDNEVLEYADTAVEVST